MIDGWGISCEIALIWLSLDFSDDQSTLVQVMAWCHQAASHYLSQCWPRSLWPYGVTRPQWVNRFYPYFSGLLHWHWGNHLIAPVPVKQPWRVWVNVIHFSTKIEKYNHNKLCAYFMGYTVSVVLNTMRPRQNGCHFPDNIFKRILNENCCISMKIPKKFVPQGPINNIPALVQIMAWRRSGDEPLPEPMMTLFNDAYMRHSASMSKHVYIYMLYWSVLYKVYSIIFYWYKKRTPITFGLVFQSCIQIYPKFIFQVFHSFIKMCHKTFNSENDSQM